MPVPENTTPAQVEKAAKLRKITAILLAVFTVILLVWDIDVANNDVRDDTVSELLRDISYNWWTLPFVLMGIMGHLFWNRPGPNRGLQFWKLAIATALVAVRDLVNLAHPLSSSIYANLIVGVVGFFCGALWWPQLAPAEAREGDQADES
jgi:hypothetical protein